jgi:hypothetical protein
MTPGGFKSIDACSRNIHLYTNNPAASSQIVAVATKFDRDAIAQHFVYLNHAAERAKVPGKLVLAIYGENPDTREKFAEVRHFEIGDHAGMTAAAMEFDGVPNRNVYAPTAIMRPDLEAARKGGEGDIVSVLALVIDGDADKDKDRPTAPLLADYIVETSAGNIQEFLFLDRPLPPVEAKPLARALQRATKAEFADDLSHVWRVPGALNWPNAEKVHKRSRSREPQPLRICKHWDKWTIVSELRTALEAHWEQPRAEPLARHGTYDTCPVKTRDFHVRLRDAGYYDRDPDDQDTARLRWIHAAKALSFDLGDAGRAIFDEVVCWRGARPDEGLPVDAGEAEYRWRDCSRLRAGAAPVTHGSLIEDAKKLYGWKGAEIYLQRDKLAGGMTKDIPLPPGPGMATVAAKSSERRNLRSRRKSAASFAGLQPPEREWVVPNWIPTEQVTLLYGDGAVGKSLLAMLLGSSAVTGSLWFGQFVKKCPVEFITAEDSESELHRRLADISRETRQPLENLHDLHVSSFADEDAIMAAANGEGQLVKTGFYDEVVEIVQESKPGLLILDTLADIYGGNEIIRAQARAFVNMLRKIAIGHQLGVVVLAHPSLEGMRSGKGTSGSTGWSNSVRSRLYLSRVFDDGGREPDNDARVLTSMKMNYGSIGNEIRMRYQRGIFVPDTNSGGDPMIASSRADRVFCDLLAKARDQKLNLHATKGRGNYAPDHFRADADKQGVKHGELVAALRRMMDDGRIENAQYGPPSRPHYRLQLKGGA